jgi:5'-nucleotidase / UDP-sugar diphosphatase
MTLSLAASRRSIPALAALALAAAATSHLSCLPTLAGVAVDLSGQQVRLTLLQTSDIHSRLLPYDFNPVKTDTDLGLIPEAGPFGGATRLAALIKRERGRSDRVLHIDTGDSFQGAPIFNLNLGEVEYKFLSLVGTDAAAIGNHEFDMGAANFTKQARDAARFPVLADNYVWEDAAQPGTNATAIYTQPYTITNVGGLRVGIIGVGNISSLNSIVEQGNSLQATPLEPNEATRAYVELLRPSVDLIIVTSHAGLTEDQELIEGYDAYYEYSVAKPFTEHAADPWVVQEWFGPVGDPGSVVRVRIPGVSGVDVVLGGHLHVVLNPPQQLTDPRGRKVLLSHGGAFSKYLIRLDTVVQVPAVGDSRAEGAEVLSSDFQVFPIDALWCSEALHAYYQGQFWNPGDFPRDPQVREGIAQCTQQEDLATTQLLLPYITDLDVRLNLTSLFAFAPVDIMRRNNSSGGDSPLGNITADSMRVRQGVGAEVAVTNSLGIRDNLYAGPLTQEAMFNVFPFENTINVMFLSGREMQEMFDFITDRSAERGCTSQAQISGARFNMDCAQSQLNALRLACDPAGTAAECPAGDRTDRAPWQCVADATLGSGGRCWAHGATAVTIAGNPLSENETYRIAVNDYIARGGSGFLVLKRNTTRVETGISLRDSLVGFIQGFCTCDDILAGKTDQYGNTVGSKGQACGTRDPVVASTWVVDDQVKAACQQAKAFGDALNSTDQAGCSCANSFRRAPAACQGSAGFDAQIEQCLAALPAGPALGRCSCRDALSGSPLCGNVTRQVRNFCERPTAMPVAFGAEDGRITRRVK